MGAAINDVEVMSLDEAGPLVGTEQSALDLIGECFGSGVELVAIPLSRLDPDFLRLGSGLAGAFIEKMQQYRLRVAIVGDIEARVSRSEPLRDFVAETNRRGQHLFVRDAGDLASRLKRF